MARYGLIALLLLTATASPGWDTAKDRASEGNDLYKKGNYAEAVKKYEEARQKAPKDLGIDFNLGNAYYRQEEYDKADEVYKSAAAAEEIGFAANALYNLGNSKYRKGCDRELAQRLGMDAESKGGRAAPVPLAKQDVQPPAPPTADMAAPGAQPPQAVQDPARIQAWEEALKTYKGAIDLLVKDEAALDEHGKQTLDDARANYEFVKRKLEQQQQQQQNQQQKQDKDQQKQQPQDKNQKENQDQKQPQPQDQDKDKDKQQQDQQQQPQKPDQKDQQKDQDKDKPKQQPKPDQQQEQQQQPQPQPAQAKMSKEDAERLLRQIRDAEEEQRKARIEKAKALADPKVEKDW